MISCWIIEFCTHGFTRWKMAIYLSSNSWKEWIEVLKEDFFSPVAPIFMWWKLFQRRLERIFSWTKFESIICASIVDKSNEIYLWPWLCQWYRKFQYNRDWFIIKRWTLKCFVITENKILVLVPLILWKICCIYCQYSWKIFSSKCFWNYELAPL